MLFYEFAGAGFVVVLVLLVALLRTYVLLNGCACFVPAGNIERLVNLFGHTQGIGFKVLEFHFDKIALGDVLLVFLVLVIELGIDLKDILFNVFVAELLKFEGLDGIGEEGAGALEYGVGIAHEVDELGVGEHAHQFLDAARVGRVFGEELRATGIPERNLNHLLEGVLPTFEFLAGDVFEEHVLVAILLHIFGEEPEVVVGVWHHIGEGKLFLLRQVNGQLHVVCGALVGHEPRHGFLEERLPEHHEVGEDGLVGGAVAEMFVAGEHVVYKRGARAPMAEDEYGVLLHGFVGQEFLVAFVLKGFEDGEQAADGFGQQVLAAPFAVNVASGGD